MDLGTVGFFIGFLPGAALTLRFGLRNRRNAKVAEEIARAEGQYFSPNGSISDLFQVYARRSWLIRRNDSEHLKEAKRTLLEGMGKHPILRVYVYALIGMVGGVIGAVAGTMIQDIVLRH